MSRPRISRAHEELARLKDELDATADPVAAYLDWAACRWLGGPPADPAPLADCLREGAKFAALASRPVLPPRLAAKARRERSKFERLTRPADPAAVRAAKARFAALCRANPALVRAARDRFLRNTRGADPEAVRQAKMDFIHALYGWPPPQR
jgi:hypothetical protein